MNRNIMIQTLRRFKVTSGYKGYYYLLDAADIISGFHTKEKPFATQNDIYIPCLLYTSPSPTRPGS